MKKITVFLLLVTFTLINAQNTKPKLQDSRPKLQLEETDFNFGELLEGTIVSHEYVIKNVGDADLNIERVRASCGCTAAMPDNDKIKPGESTKIKVTFNTSRRMGQQKKYVYVFTNDPENPDVRLSFSAVVKRGMVSNDNSFPQLTFEKNYHNFGDVKQGAILSLTIVLTNEGNELLKIDEIKSNCECIITTLSKNDLTPGDTGELTIDFDTSDLSGTITRRITIISNDPKYPEKTITLFANILRNDS